MKPNDLPNVSTVMVALTTWLTGLAAIAWISLSGLTSALDLVPPVLLTACAVAAAALLFRGIEQDEIVPEEVRVTLNLNDAPARHR
jgi:hypothetical protein